ncbi:cation:proton antiporter [Nitratireductor luteus]|uniref:cation:proton antiporter domain-containing protein n=1 Tax=Nitratireductor luteus TaxID=2976980 RepID=UPI002240ABB6|nr:cation:proton antiporter [Nitratireductor luteus]
MENHGVLALTFACFAAYALLGRKLQTSVLSGPLLFTGLGLAFALAGRAPFSFAGNAVIEFLATVTLVVILFRDAANIRISSVMAERAIAGLTLRLLVVGIPLTITAGAAAAMIVFPAIGFYGAIVLAIVLTPTDAALAQPVFGNRALPEVPREALDAESGLNDGLCLPLLLVVLGLATGADGPSGLTGHVLFFAGELVFGPLAGGLVGLGGAWATLRYAARGESDPVGRTPIMVALAGLAYFTAELVGGNGFLAAFTAGLAFGWRLPPDLVERTSRFAITEGSLLANVTFLFFGVAILPRAFDSPVGPALLYAALSLTVIRMAPVWIAALGTDVGLRARLLMGWFGPRGLASVLYLILVVDRSGFAEAEMVTDIAVFTIVLSIFLHGISAPFAVPIFLGGRGGEVR